LISNIWTIYPGNKNSSLLHDEATFWCWGWSDRSTHQIVCVNWRQGNILNGQLTKFHTIFLSLGKPKKMAGNTTNAITTVVPWSGRTQSIPMASSNSWADRHHIWCSGATQLCNFSSCTSAQIGFNRTNNMSSKYICQKVPR
jgi:hypothetical protein